MKPMLYQEFSPAASLRHHVECFWVLSNNERVASPSVERILPDGCMELILNCAEPFSRLQVGQWQNSLRLYWLGR